MSSNPVVDVSQFSRQSARTPVSSLAERYASEREALIQEKNALQVALADVDAWKMERALDITRRKLPTHQAIESTQRLEVEYASKRKEITTQLSAIDERLVFMKARKREKSQAENDSLIEVMRRVEGLLETLVAIARRQG